MSKGTTVLSRYCRVGNPFSSANVPVCSIRARFWLQVEKFTQQIWLNECLLTFYLSAPFNNILVETFWASMTLAPPQKFRLPDNNPIPGLWIWVFAWCSFLSRAWSWLEMRVIWTGSFFSNPWWSRWCGWGMLKLWKRRVQMHICNHWVYPHNSAGPLIVFSKDGPKQNAGQLLIPVSDTVSYAQLLTVPD